MRVAPRPESWFTKLDRFVVAANRTAMIAALAVMSVVVFVSVVVRYLTDYSVPWSEEVARYLMVWLTFLGIGPVLRLGGHVAIDTLQDAVPPRLAIVLRGLILLCVAAMLGLLVRHGYALVLRTVHQTTAVTEIPFAWVSAAVPTGAALALWHWAAIARGYLLARRFEASADASAGQISAS
jgi:TRAP-type C4-dicarboxylate transport system permease small subunit